MLVCKQKYGNVYCHDMICAIRYVINTYWCNLFDITSSYVRENNSHSLIVGHKRWILYINSEDVKYFVKRLANDLFYGTQPCSVMSFRVMLALTQLCRMASSTSPASKRYRTHMGHKWVFIWVLYGQPIRDSWGICNMVPRWTHMGKAIWELYGFSMGKSTHIYLPEKTTTNF